MTDSTEPTVPEPTVPEPTAPDGSVPNSAVPNSAGANGAVPDAAVPDATASASPTAKLPKRVKRTPKPKLPKPKLPKPNLPELESSSAAQPAGAAKLPKLPKPGRKSKRERYSRPDGDGDLYALHDAADDTGEVTPDTPRSPRTARMYAVASARAVAGAVGLGIAVVAVLVAGLVEIPDVVAKPASVTVTPVPTAQQLVCAGTMLRLGSSNGEDATTAAPVGQSSSQYGATSGEVSTKTLDNSNGSPLVVSVTPADGAEPTPLVAGSQSQRLGNSDFAGFAAVDCAAASTDAWLAGGSTTVGRTTLITLANPSDVQSTVGIHIYDDSGLLSTPGSTGIIVPAKAQRVLSVAGFAPDTETPVIHVTSKGGQIVANLQQSIVRGLEPAGIDIVGATAAPSTTNTIPGVVIRGATAVEERLGQEGSDDLHTVIRLFVPGDTGTDATIRVTPDGAVGSGNSFQIALDAGVVTDVPIENLVDGRYTVSIDTGEPVVAAVRASTAISANPGIGTTDFAWYVTPEQIIGTSLFAVATAPAATITVSNPSDQAVDVTLTRVGTEEPQVMKVEANASKSITVNPAANYRIDSPNAVSAMIGYTFDGQLAAQPVREPLESSGKITIYP